MKKIICLLFALALCLGVLISCDSTTDGSGTESSVADSENTGGTQNEEAETIKITFGLAGGEIVDGKSYAEIKSGKTLEAEDMPTVVRDGYVFVGWENSTTNKMWKKSDVFKKNTTLVAVWETEDTDDYEGLEVTHKAVIEIENYGTIELDLYGKEAPITVDNFEKLANSGFYDGLTLHRIIEGFVMQGGCPKGDGTGGSGENIKGEFTSNGVNNTISHVRGVISMARSGHQQYDHYFYDTASSQFFIMHKDYKSLDGKYAGFGMVSSGMDVVDRICSEAEPIDGNGTIAKENQPVIKSIKVVKYEKADGEGENSGVKYDYDMSDYISLPDYKNHRFEIDMANIKHAIGSYLMQASSEYTVRRGDKIQVDIRFYALLDPVVDAKGSEITELFQQNLWLEAVGTPNGDGEYQISSLIEEQVLGTKIGATVSYLLTMDDGFFAEEYRGKRLFVEITVKNKACEAGDVLTAAFTGYYIDENGNIIKENGKDKTFDSSENTPFFIGSHLAIEDFEKGLIGAVIGEEKEVYATFPEDYAPDPTLAGQRVLFKVKIKAFYTPPAYNDGFVKNYFSTAETVEEFEALMVRELVLSKVYGYIGENAQVLEYPTKEYNEAKAQLDRIAEMWQSQYGMTIEQYISSQYGMSIDQYIKSNMKTEMIFYRLQEIIGADAIPTEAEIKAEREALIEQNKNEYMLQGLTESQAIAEAKKYVDALGADYIYEQVMYDKIDNIIPTQVQNDIIPTDLVFSWENN